MGQLLKIFLGVFILALSAILFYFYFSNSSGGGGTGASVIVYVCNDGDQEICVIYSDGSRGQKLTENETRDFRPAVNSHGEIVYICEMRSTADGSDLSTEDEICVIRSDGSGFRRLGSRPRPPKISDTPLISETGQIYFVCIDADLDIEICTLHFDGSGARVLTSNTWHEFALAANETTGLAFICVPSDSNSLFDTEICVINYDGSGFRNITSNAVLKQGVEIDNAGNILSNCYEDLIFSRGFCLMHRLNLSFRQLDTKTIGTMYTMNNLGQVAYQCSDGLNNHICIMRFDGTGERQLTEGFTNDRHPDIDDEGRIAFLCDDQICLVNQNGSGLRQLVLPPGNRPDPETRLQIR